MPISWAMQKISQVNVTSSEAFWGFLRGGVYRKEPDDGKLFAMLWQIWPHCDKVIFKGKALYHGALEGCEYEKGIPVGSLLYFTKIHPLRFGGSPI